MKIYGLFKDIHEDQKGNYFLLSTVVFLVLIILTVGIVEFGRVMLIRNQLQTAGDAAAMAVAGNDDNITKWVKLVVTTDRGQHTVCDSQSCWCSACGTVSIRVMGLEEDLLDDGQWQDYCMPACDCGGSDCTVQITDRWVTMRTATVATGAQKEDIEEATRDILESTKIALSYHAYHDQAHVYATLKNVDSLTSVYRLLKSNADWISRYSNTNCRQFMDESNTESYNRCVSTGHNDWQQMQAGLEQVEHMMDAQKKLAGLQAISTTAGVSEEFTGEVVHDYLTANLPGSWAEGIEIYDQRNSPYYPSVVVYAMKDVPVLMRDFISIPLMLDPGSDYLFGVDENIATVETCSQGDTHYIDPSLTQYSEYGELVASPEERYYVERPQDACHN